MRCAVNNCNNNNKTKPCKISFFNFPSDTELLKQWERFCRRDSKMNVKTSQICMEHFKPEDFENSLQFKMGFTKRLFLKRGAVPTVRKVSSTDDECQKACERRIQKRKNKKVVEMHIEEHNAESVSCNAVNVQRMQPKETEIYVEDQIQVKSEVLSEGEHIKDHNKESLCCNEVNELPSQPIKTEIFLEEQIHVKSEVFSEDEIVNEYDASNENKPPIQPMETETFIKCQFQVKSELLLEDEIIQEHHAQYALRNREVKELPVQTLKTEVFMECQHHPESEIVSEHQKEKFVENNDEKNKIKCLEMEIERLCKEKSELKITLKNQAAELEALTEKRANDCKMYKTKLCSLKTQLAQANYEVNNLEEKLLGIFSKGQIANLKAGVKRTKWSEEEVTESITLYAASAKFYKLLYRKHFPLPAVSILQSWAQKIYITPGLLEPVFKLLSASIHMTEIDKISVLSFEEAKIRKTYCYDATSDTTISPVNYVQVAMITGLTLKWSQPIYYKYDCKMTANILNNILSKLKLCGYTVAAIVCDLDEDNRALFNKLQVTEEKPWFTFDGEKVFVFADVPHIITVLRNHFVHDGFIINGKPVRAEIISKLLKITSGDFSIAQEISETNFNIGDADRQNVKLAVKLFSHTVAQAITTAASQGHLDGLNWEECHRLFKLTNDWFDVMNVKVPYPDTRDGLSPETQNHILEEMTLMVKDMRAIGQNVVALSKRNNSNK